MNSADAERAVMAPGGSALEHALRYAAAAAEPVTLDLMRWPTPCRDWDVRTLLLHAGESLAALAEGLDGGHIALQPQSDCLDLEPDPAGAFRDRAGRLLRSCRGAGRVREIVTIADCPMAPGVLVLAGALEIAAHGWDISQACGCREPIPDALALDLLQVAPFLVTTADRHVLFAPPVSVTAAASPSDRLAAFLGRAVGLDVDKQGGRRLA
jgi:uncharacterized protein (TIGR03086 family)